VIPAPEHRSRAIAVFHALYRVLSAPAQRHFDAAMVP